MGTLGTLRGRARGPRGDLGEVGGRIPGRTVGSRGAGGSPGGGGCQRIPVAQVIGGNEDPERVVLKDLAPPAVARALRVYPRAPRAMSVCLRLELYGCPWDGEWRLVTPPVSPPPPGHHPTPPPRVTPRATPPAQTPRVSRGGWVGAHGRVLHPARPWRWPRGDVAPTGTCPLSPAGLLSYTAPRGHVMPLDPVPVVLNDSTYDGYSVGL